MNAQQQQLPRRGRRLQQQPRQSQQQQPQRRQYSRAFFNSNLQGTVRGNDLTQQYHNPRNGHQVHEQIPRPPMNRSSQRAPVQNGLSNGNSNSVAPLAGPARNQPPRANRVHQNHHHDHEHARQPVQQNAQQQALPQYVFYPTVQYGHDGGQYYFVPYGQVPQNYAHQMAAEWALQGGQHYGAFYGQHHHHQWTQHHQHHHYLPVQCHDDRLMCYNCGRVQVIQVDESIETDPIEIDEQDQ